MLKDLYTGKNVKSENPFKNLKAPFAAEKEPTQSHDHPTDILCSLKRNVDKSVVVKKYLALQRSRRKILTGIRFLRGGLIQLHRDHTGLDLMNVIEKIGST